MSRTVCGFEYQDGSPVVSGGGDIPTCACNTFAVGRCTVCAADVCGLHSAMLENRRLCSRHHAQAARDVQRRATAAADAERAETERRRAEAAAAGERRRDEYLAVPEMNVAHVVAWMRGKSFGHVNGEGVTRRVPVTNAHDVLRQALERLEPSAWFNPSKQPRGYLERPVRFARRVPAWRFSTQKEPRRPLFLLADLDVVAGVGGSDDLMMSRDRVKTEWTGSREDWVTLGRNYPRGVDI